MAILWCGGEDVDFANGNPLTTTDGGYRRSAYSRCALYSGSRFWSNPFLGGEVTSAWLSTVCHENSSSAEIYDHYITGLTDSDGLTGYFMKRNYGKLELWVYDSGWAWVDEETGVSLLTGNPMKFDMHIEDFGVSGRIRVYLEESYTPLIDYSGDLSISGMTGFSTVTAYGGPGSSQGAISEIIVADTDTRLMTLMALTPNAAGDTNDWNGAYTDIDEAARNDADGINTDAVENDFLANLSGLPAGSWQINAVKTAIRGYDTTAARALAAGIKTNAAIHVGTEENVAGFTHIEKIYQNNPETTNPFTVGEIAALQLAIRSKAGV